MSPMLLLLAGSADLPAIVLLSIAISAGLFAYIFYLPWSINFAPEKTRLGFLRERKENVYDNLRDLNFEFKAGKYPESDYEEMRSALQAEAAAILAEMETLAGPVQARPHPVARGQGMSGQKTKGATL